MEADVTRDPTLSIPVDNDTVSATRYEPPNATGRSPVLLWPTPYHKDDQTTYGQYDPLLEYLAVNGYEVIVTDLIGTGASTGAFGELLAPETGAEAAAIVEWLADQDWTTGQVGMIGKSAAGFVCLAAAAEDPDPLQAIVPIMCPAGRRQGPYAPGGLLRLDSMLAWLTLYAASAVQPPSRRDSAGKWREIWQERLERIREAERPLYGVPDVFGRDRSDEYWEWEVATEEITVPTFAVGGYRDTFSVETIAWFRALDTPKRLLMGPWRHVIPHRGREVSVDFRRQAVEWFDTHLREAETAARSRPPITYWTERQGGRQVNGGVWRGMDGWPTIAQAEQTVTFTATPDGLAHGWADDQSPVERSYEFDQTVGMASKDVGAAFLDTSADDARALIFETDELETPVEWTGNGRAAIRLASTTAEAAVCIRIVDVAPDGRARPVTRGATRLGDGPSAVEIDTDVPRTIPVDLRPTSHIFERNHRIRLAISAADFPRLCPMGNQGCFTVKSSPHTPTKVVFPGQHGPVPEFEDTVRMESADDTRPVVPTAVTEQDTTWQTCREHMRDRATTRRTRVADVALPHVEKTIDRSTEIAVDRDDPRSLDARSRLEFTLDDDDEHVSVVATVNLTGADRRLSTVVTVDGDQRFERTWME